MLDVKYIREQQDVLRAELEKRGSAFDLATLSAVDERRRSLIKDVDSLRARQNTLSDGIASASAEQRPELIEEVRSLKEQLAILEPQLTQTEHEYKQLCLQLPNISHESVPVGSDERGNVVIKTVGDKPRFAFQPLPHQDIPAVRPCIDFERGAKLSGSRFWYLTGPLARLDLALMHYAFDFYTQKGFLPMVVPMLVREEALWGTGFLPADANEIYSVNKDEDNLYLVGTAEVALAGYHMDETIDVSRGPLKYVGYSACFRREAGTYGKDMKGMLRGHQFQKVEMFIFCAEDQSWPLHEFLLQCAEEFLQSLELHYQVLNMCTGDIGAPNAKKYDIETWMPGQNAYRETNSCSNDTDFQARRLNCTYKDSAGKRRFPHTLNNTGCADLRTLIAILENNQKADGSISIPSVLQPYCGFDVISAP